MTSLNESYQTLVENQKKRRATIATLTAEADQADAAIENFGNVVQQLGGAFAPATPVKAAGTRKPRSPESLAKAAATREANKAAGADGKKPRDYTKEVEQRRARKAAKAAATDPLAS